MEKLKVWLRDKEKELSEKEFALVKKSRRNAEK